MSKTYSELEEELNALKLANYDKMEQRYTEAMELLGNKSNIVSEDSPRGHVDSLRRKDSIATLSRDFAEKHADIGFENLDYFQLMEKLTKGTHKSQLSKK